MNLVGHGDATRTWAHSHPANARAPVGWPPRFSPLRLPGARTARPRRPRRRPHPARQPSSSSSSTPSSSASQARSKSQSQQQSQGQAQGQSAKPELGLDVRRIPIEPTSGSVRNPAGGAQGIAGLRATSSGAQASAGTAGQPGRGRKFRRTVGRQRLKQLRAPVRVPAHRPRAGAPGHAGGRTQLTAGLRAQIPVGAGKRGKRIGRWRARKPAAMRRRARNPTQRAARAAGGRRSGGRRCSSRKWNNGEGAGAGAAGGPAVRRAGTRRARRARQWVMLPVERTVQTGRPA